MKRKTSLFVTAVLSLCICLSLACFLPADAAAEGEIAKVTVRTEPSNPIVMMKISEISAVVSSNNGSIASVTWLDSAGNVDTDTVDNCVYTVQVRVAAPAGYIFAADVEGAINNSLCTVSRADDGSYVDMSRVIEPALAAPTVWWEPKGETVDAGGLASFVATASPYYDKLAWNLISPEGKTTGIDTVTSKFPGVTYTQDDTIARLNIHNVPAEMDGWKVSCTFTGPGGSATSSAASISVKGAVKATPTPKPTPTPTPAPSPTDAGSGTAAGDDHKHEFADSWSFDESGHWHECSCGEKEGFAPHSYTWTELAKATKKHDGQERGVCDVCGYESVRSVAYEKTSAGNPDMLRIILYIAVGVVVIALLLMIIQSVSDRNYRRRRRRKKSNNRRY